MDDLWPKDLKNLRKSTPKAPVTILKEQSSLLATKTDGLVTAEVRPIRDPFHPEKFFYSFRIMAPVLDDYKYELFNISYDIDLYPVTIKMEPKIRNEVRPGPPSFPDEVGASNEQEFIDLLGKILTSEKTKQVVAALLSQIEA